MASKTNRYVTKRLGKTKQIVRREWKGKHFSEQKQGADATNVNQCVPYDTNNKKEVVPISYSNPSLPIDRAKKKAEKICFRRWNWRFRQVFDCCLVALVWQRWPFPKTDPAEERTSKGEKNRENAILEISYIFTAF